MNTTYKTTLVGLSLVAVMLTASVEAAGPFSRFQSWSYVGPNASSSSSVVIQGGAASSSASSSATATSIGNGGAAAGAYGSTFTGTIGGFAVPYDSPLYNGGDGVFAPAHPAFGR